MKTSIPNIYSTTVNVGTYDIDHRRLIKIPALLRYMHEAAMQNSIRMKVALWDMAPHHLSWVLMRLHLKVYKTPQLGDQLYITTYPSGFEKLFTYRDYQVFGASKDLLASVSSTWLLMDTVARKLSPIPDFIRSIDMPDTSVCLPRIKHKQLPFERADLSKTSTVGWHQLDFNNHLGNVNYIELATDAMPLDFLQNHELKEVDILYRQECNLDEVLITESQIEHSSDCRHRIIKENTQKEVALLNTQWQKLPS